MPHISDSGLSDPSLSDPSLPASDSPRYVPQVTTSDFQHPPGGYPEANPSDLCTPHTARADARADASAARELGAYAEQDYSESVLQRRKRASRVHRFQRGKAVGASRLSGDPQPSDSAQFEAFDPQS